MRKNRLEEFSFCDREDQRRDILRFIECDLAENEPNILWIRGQKKAGTTWLLQEVTKSLDPLNCTVLMNEEITDGGDGGRRALEELLKNLESPRIAKTVGSIARTAAEGLHEASSPLAWIADAVFLGTEAIQGSRDSKPVYRELANRLLDQCSSSGKRNVLIIDGYQFASPAFQDVIREVLSELCDENRIRFIVTTQTDTETDGALRILTSKIESRRLAVEPFADSKYFHAVLRPFFHCLDPNDQAVDDIFHECGGNVGILRRMLMLYFASGKMDDSDNIDAFQSFIAGKRAKRHSPESSSGFITRCIVDCLDVVDTPVSREGLGVLVLEIGKRMHLFEPGIAKERQLVVCSIDDLVERLVIIGPDSGIHLDKTSVVLRQSGMRRQVAQALFDYLSPLENANIKDLFPYSTKTEVMARVAWESDASSKIDWNLQLAHEIAHSKDPRPIIVPAKRLLSAGAAETMPKSKLVELARACYGAGQYDTCRHLLTNRANRIKPKKGKATFEIFFLLGKAENALGHRDEASRYLKSAIKCSKELDQSVSAKNMLQLVYAEMPNKEEQMTELFEDILARARSSDCWSPSQCMAMRTIVDFPGRYDDADELLDRALLESEGCNDEMIRPCLLTAKGLQSLRAGDTQGAQKSYAQAIGILKNVRPHEQAYLESDLGTCSMLMGDYNAALDSFRRGSAWAATPFIQKVLYSNESMCLGLLGRLEEALERVDALELFIRDEDDPLIIERIGMSILFILLLSGATVAAEPPSKRMLQFDACADAVRAVAHKSRVIERRDRYVELKGKDPQVIRREIEASPPTYHGAFFQPWAVTLHHD